MAHTHTLSFLGLLALTSACSDSPKKASNSFDRCLASCEANNKNVPGHEWVEKYVDGAGYAAFSACLDEAVKLGTTAARHGCSEKGTQACARACAAD
ncbi:MAG: hypothetical protein RL653_1487 [Pseudomonadota bacterium]|jgi:hypothetical protein